MSDLRIASFLPAATEMVCALGLLDHLVCISHECDFPPEVRKKPIAVRCGIDLSDLTIAQTDEAVSKHLQTGKSLYEIDENVLQETKPNLIVTQNLCQVCAPSGNEASQAIVKLHPKPEVIYQTPKSFENVLEDLKILGEKTGTKAIADQIIHQTHQRIGMISQKTSKIRKKPRVFFMEWVDPIYCGGHWIPQMIQSAGGDDAIARNGMDSVRIPWEEVVSYQPEVLLISPCGFDTEKATKQAEQLKHLPGWSHVPAVKSQNVFAVDANSYFARPGPRLIDGIELLAHLFHPKLIEWNGSSNAFRRISL
jgi:iron complex transport system substrate-binding protein